MPKLIDHDERRHELAAATWRVILHQGIGNVSIRTVAAEAGVSTGSLRHIFPSRTDLLVHAMGLVDVQVEQRMVRHRAEPDARSLALKVLAELLPLDEERRAEMEVNIALFAEAPADPRIAEVRDRAHADVRAVCVGLIELLRDRGRVRADVDVEEAATSLHALTDGLALHMIIAQDPTVGQRAIQILHTHLDSL
ncbi:MAG: TetR/AcrR family transcriptional regulator [Propioniciclava sp.]